MILRNFSDHGEQIVTVLPIIHSAPRNLEEAIELPFKVKQHLGLDSDRSWVILSEVNRFVWPGPDLRPVPPAESGRFHFGHLPPRLFRTIREQFLSSARAQKLRTVR